MRLWSIHPKYLDAKGLVALWREGLLAQKVLQDETKGYRNHPQLDRFKNHPQPVAAIACYLTEVWKEAKKRGYHFDKSKIGTSTTINRIPVTTGQMQLEFARLLEKLKQRDPQKHNELLTVKVIESHPVVKVIKGPIAEWEKTKS